MRSMRRTSSAIRQPINLGGFRWNARRARTTGALACFAVCVGAFGGASTAGAAERGPKILQTVLQRYEDSVSDIDNYTVAQQVMGTASTTYFEKKVVDGRPTFTPVSAFTVMQERLDSQRMSFGRAALSAGLNAVAPEATAASYQQMGSFIGSLEKLGPAQLGNASDIGGSPLEAVRHVLVQGASQAGLQQAASRLGDASTGQMQALAGALAHHSGKGILGALGKVALGQLKRLAVDSFIQAVAGPMGNVAASALQGGAGGGAPGMLGGAGRGLAGGPLGGTAMGGGGGIAGVFGGAGGGLGGAGGALGGIGGLGQQAVGGLMQAGLGALMGGLSAVTARAMTPDLSALDRAAGGTITPDVHDLMHSIGDNVRLAGSTKLDGHKIWNLEVQDVSRLKLEDADAFTPESVTLGIDRDLYVLRSATISGEVRANGRKTPVSMETRLDDYRDVQGMLYPFHTVTVVKGMSATLSKEEQRQVAGMPADMQAKMSEAMKQLQKLPPQQRAMAEQMMKQQMPQLQQMMKQTAAMANPEGSEITVDVQNVAVNQGRPASLQTWGPSP
jgi:hypothetical protein